MTKTCAKQDLNRMKTGRPIHIAPKAKLAGPTSISQRRKLKCDREKERRNGMNERFGELMGLLLMLDPGIGGGVTHAENVMVPSIVPAKDLLPRADLLERACVTLRAVYQEKEQWKQVATEARCSDDMSNINQKETIATESVAIESRYTKVPQISSLAPVPKFLSSPTQEVTQQQQDIQQNSLPFMNIRVPNAILTANEILQKLDQAEKVIGHGHHHQQQEMKKNVPPCSNPHMANHFSAMNEILRKLKHQVAASTGHHEAMLIATDAQEENRQNPHNLGQISFLLQDQLKRQRQQQQSLQAITPALNSQL